MAPAYCDAAAKSFRKITFPTIRKRYVGTCKSVPSIQGHIEARIAENIARLEKDVDIALRPILNEDDAGRHADLHHLGHLACRIGFIIATQLCISKLNWEAQHAWVEKTIGEFLLFRILSRSRSWLEHSIGKDITWERVGHTT